MRVFAVATSVALPELPLASTQNLTVSRLPDLRIHRNWLKQDRKKMFVGRARFSLPIKWCSAYGIMAYIEKKRAS
jgi:hypothetical protein